MRKQTRIVFSRGEVLTWVLLTVYCSANVKPICLANMFGRYFKVFLESAFAESGDEEEADNIMNQVT